MYARGSATYNGTVFQDTCAEFTEVTDYFCRDGKLVSENHECDPGYGCVGGVCELQVPACSETDAGNDTSVRGTTTVVKGLATVSDQTDECVDQGTLIENYCLTDGTAASQEMLCPSGKRCADGRCVKSRCSETDGGIDPYHGGVTASGDQKFTDTCVNEHAITEYYCYGDEIRDERISCGPGYFCDTGNSECMEGSES
jgi:hypothetical protein